MCKTLILGLILFLGGSNDFRADGKIAFAPGQGCGTDYPIRFVGGRPEANQSTTQQEVPCTLFIWNEAPEIDPMTRVDGQVFAGKKGGGA